LMISSTHHCPASSHHHNFSYRHEEMVYQQLSLHGPRS
jgi:hypothetical protein